MDFTGHTNRLATSLQRITFPEPDSTDTSTSEEAPEDPEVATGLSSLRQAEVMKSATTDLVRAGLQFYYKQFKQGLRNGELAAVVGETKVTVLCTWDPVAKQPALVAHFEPLRTPSSPRCKVEVHGSPRQNATAKDSQWVRDRKALEAALAPDSNEALLVDDDTQDVYEGLSSNFFALDRARRTILMAPPGTVLQGTIQKVVEFVCKAQNIPIDYTFPNLKRIDEWEGAFISSTSRLVLPIEKLVLQDGAVKTFEESPLIELIRREVLQECIKRVENMINDQEL